MSYVEISGISKKYDEVQVLKNINLSIEKGELVTLLGPSGCGKTTLLRMIAGFENVNAGHLLIDGNDVTQDSPGSRGVSMVFQEYTLFPTMTVYNNIGYGLKIKGKSKAEIKEAVTKAIEMVDMSGFETQYPSQLSGGQKQRVALARAIVTDANILLMDEPFSAIDAKLRKSLQVKIKEIHKKLNLTTIFVTHDQEEAMKISDRICLLNQGEIVQIDTPGQLYANPNSMFTASFMGNYNIIRKDCAYMTFRSEVVEINAENWLPNDSYEYFQGKVRDIILSGKTIRFLVDSEIENIDVDYLYTDVPVVKIGEVAYLRVPKAEIKCFDV